VRALMGANLPTTRLEPRPDASRSLLRTSNRLQISLNRRAPRISIYMTEPTIRDGWKPLFQASAAEGSQGVRKCFDSPPSQVILNRQMGRLSTQQAPVWRPRTMSPSVAMLGEEGCGTIQCPRWPEHWEHRCMQPLKRREAPT